MDRKEQKKAYYLKNKDKIKAYMKEYEEKNKEKRKEYREANREKKKEYMKQYDEANKEKLTEYNRTPFRLKSKTIAKWKIKGLICEDYNVLYERYLESTNCEECGCEYGKFGDGSGTFRCMDHSHITGLFRNFLCNRCNIRRGE